VPLANRSVLGQLAVAHGRLLAAPSSEVEAAAALVGIALDHPLFIDAAAAEAEGRCMRETPVTLRLDDGSLVEGTVDLAFQTASGFVVVDFKTDAPSEEVLARYRRQVGLYATAIRRATGEPVTAFLMTL
jgi:ATP-dependent exoDNAse (exonuclease V) beta subunit